MCCVVSFVQKTVPPPLFPLGLSPGPSNCLHAQNKSPAIMSKSTDNNLLSVKQTPHANPDVWPELERYEIFVELNQTARDDPRGKCVHHLFEQQVERAPEAVAVVFEGQSLTYQELNRRANLLAHRLRDLGVGPEQLVGLRTERGIEMVVGIIAILKAGGAYLPLDPVYPRERVAFMLADSGAKVIVTQNSLRADCDDINIHIALIDDALSGPGSNPPHLATATNLAYVIYTSGSTGMPKGVGVTHHNVARLFSSSSEWFKFDENDVWTLFHSCSFDFSVWELWGALLHGGRLVVVPYWTSRSPRDFLELLSRERVTVLNQTPSAFRQLMSAELAGTSGSLSLRYVIFGGEALNLPSLRPWLEKHGDECPALVNMYGITETTVHVTYRPIRWADLISGQGSVIGVPIPDLKVYILEPNGEPTPVGTPGEMYVGGEGVARGYINREELTKERFLVDPFNAQGEGRLYRTGDLARRLENGDLEYLGRIDQQVKIRGFRVELGEIEATLENHPAVAQCVVIVREDNPGDQRLVAYVVLRDKGISTAELKQHLSRTLPSYMVPSGLVMLNELPLTSNGKIDRKALSAPDHADLQQAAYVAPRTPAEDILAAIWADVLGIERVGIHDNFFELGGHSLLVINILDKMARAKLYANVRTIYLTPTIAELATAVADVSDDVEVPPNRIPADCQAISPDMLTLVRLTPAEIERVVAAVPGGAANIQDIYPLSPLQEGILFHHRMASDGDPYLVKTVFGSSSREPINRYLNALQLVIARHDILRTAFLWEGLPEPVQVVWRQAPILVEELRFDATKGDIAEQLEKRFDPRHFRLDVGQAPILRIFIAHDAANARWVMLRIHHHLMEDHTTDELMSEEIHLHLQGQAHELLPPLPFRNFVAHTRLGIPAKEHEAYFRNMLAAVDEPTAPFGLMDVKGDGSEIEEARCLIHSGLARQLRETAHRHGVSTASVFHLAWAKVLSQCSGRDDVVFGTVLFGRMHAGQGAERVMGPCINTLPLRLQLGDTSVKDGIRQTHNCMAQLLGHEHASLAVAQRCSALVTSAPLFSALLNFRHLKIRGQIPETANHAMAAAVSKMGLNLLKFEERTNYPLELSVDDLGDGFMLEAQVQSPIDPQRICAYMHTALEQLVAALETSPTSALRSLNVLPDAERQQLLVEWNDTARDYGEPALLHRLIEKQAATTPDSIALEFEGQTLTYAGLNHRANQLARHLRRKGVGPDVLVGVFAERSFEMVLALLAILKAGGAYVPLDPSYPPERLAHMLADAQALLVLSQPHLAEQLPAGAKDWHLMDPSWEAYAYESGEDLEDIGKPENLAYVIFTSGSTGRPKGAMNEHRGICNRLLWMQQQYGLTADDCILQKTPFSFDVSVWEFFWPLLAGARLVIARPEGHRDSDYLVGLIRERGITTLHFVPSMLRVFLEHEGVEACRSLKRVICSGEALTHELQERFFARLPEAELHNLYGPTEAAVDVTYWACQQNDKRLTVPIGRPVANTQIYVLDPQLAPVPIGVPGELFIGGVQVGRGYVNRDELTNEHFIPDPFSHTAGARLYKTGDLVRHLPDGAIEYLGRLDYQVKLRGQRIELGEIEATLDTHAGVAQSVVMMREDNPGDQRLVAYVVKRQVAPSVTELKEHLAAQLPSYMVPSAFVLLEELPLMANGKIDSKALPAPEHSLVQQSNYVAPRTAGELVLAGIWAEVLGLERVGIHDNFFELGGHSLLALIVIERMRQAELHADIRSLFLMPTIAALAAMTGGDGGDVEVPPNRIPPGCTAITPEMLTLVKLSPDEIERVVAAVPGGAPNIQDVYPLGPLQEGFLFHHRLTSESSGDLYIMETQFAFDSRARLDRYIQALQMVVDRHDILRTAFLWEGLSDPVQVVCRRASLIVEELSLEAADGDIARQLSQHINNSNHRFDLSVPPMIHICIAHDGANDSWVYHQLIHHLQYDQATDNLQEEELRAYLQGQGDPLPAPRPFRNYIAQARLGVPLKEHQAFFNHMLADVAEPTAPFGFTDVLGDGSRVEEGRLFLDSGLARRLHEIGHRIGVSTASLFHLAWAKVLSQCSGRDDVVFGTVLFGRMHGGDGVKRALGPCINTLPLRLQVSDTSVMDGTRHTHALLAKLLRHEHAPLGLVQRCSAAGVNVPVFSSILNYRRPSLGVGMGRHSKGTGETQAINKNSANTPTITEWFYEEIEGREFIHFSERTNYPLTLSVDDFGAGFRLVAQVQSPIDPQRICAYMHTALEQLVAALETSPTSALRSLNVLPDAERQQLLVEWNDTARDYGEPALLHRLIEKQAATTPDSIALEFEGQTLTYAGLNHRANQLARHLRRKGVGPDVLVGVFAERSFEMVLALLAILKAGGAYVPLDPSYPPERLAHMLADAQALLVLSQPHLAEQLPAGAKDWHLMDPSWEAYAYESGEDLEDIGKPENLAYVIFTSGSTGRPKGAMNEHRGICNRLLWMQQQYGLTADDCILQKTPFSFDVSVWEFFWPLLAGARLVIARPEGHRDSDYLVGLIRERGITTLHFVPSMLRVFLEHEGVEACRSLKRVICSGEALTHELQERFFARLPEAELHNLYGPTEAAVDVTYWACQQNDKRLTVPIGRPVANTQIYVLDPQLAPVPIGVPGELFIGGVQVGRGYVNRDELTNEHFIPDPFSHTAGARLYKTGDLVRHLPDGAIEYLGRLDYQVKLRGQRIELGEIEATLDTHAGVAQSVVMMREDNPGDQRLVAYVVKRQVAPSVTELKEHLAAQLPSYMVPSAFVLLEELPLMANGKLDRHHLPGPEVDNQEVSTESGQAKDLLELRLIRIWERLFQRSGIGRDDNFFELGGHSLQAARLAAEIDKLLGRRIPIATLFQSPTIASFVRRLTDDQWAPAWSSLVPLQPLGSKPPLFLIHGWGGDVYVFLNLARRMKADRPVYGIQAVGLDELRPRHASVEEMARHYAQEIRSMQPEGPYHLAGLSLGGWIAYAVAQELTRLGGKVALLGLFDTRASSHVPLDIHVQTTLRYLGGRLGFHLKQWRALPLAEFGHYFTYCSCCAWHHLLGKRHLQSVTAEPAPAKQENGRVDYFNLVAARYRPSVYSGHVEYFAAEATSPGDFAFWNSMARGGVSVHRVPGSHGTMLEGENGEALAKALEAALDRTR